VGVVRTASCVLRLLCRLVVVTVVLVACVVSSIPLAIAATTIIDSTAKPLVFLSMFVHLLHRQLSILAPCY
jgi:hypothetical protein